MANKRDKKKSLLWDITNTPVVKYYHRERVRIKIPSLKTQKDMQIRAMVNRIEVAALNKTTTQKRVRSVNSNFIE